MVTNEHIVEMTKQLNRATALLNEESKRLNKLTDELIIKNKAKLKKEPAGSEKNDMTLTVIRASGDVEKIRDKRGILIR